MNLGVLFFGSIHERTGAGKVVLSFAESKHLFSKNGIDNTNVYSLDEGSNYLTAKEKREASLKTSVKRIANTLIKSSACGSYYLINKLYFGKGVKVVNTSWESIQTNDVLIFHEIYTCFAYINKCNVAHVPPKPYILILHTNGEVYKMTRIYYPNIVDTKYERRLNDMADTCMKNASKIVFVAKMAADHFVALFPEYKSKVAVVYNGISPSPVHENPSFDGTIRLVTVGTVNARKNQLLQVEAIGSLKDRCDVHLCVVGGGDKLDECKERAKVLGVEDRIVFLGSRDDIPEILSKNNLFVMSSYDEGLPISAIEALRGKLPVILTNVGGNKELIKDNGYLINPTLDDLTQAIIRFAESTEEQKRMSIASSKLFREKFCVEQMINGYSQIVNSIKE